MSHFGDFTNLEKNKGKKFFFNPWKKLIKSLGQVVAD